MNSMAQSELAAELKFFEEHRAEWLEHYEEKFALIKGTKIYGFYDSWEKAYEAGVEKIGVVPFLVKEVLKEDPLEHTPALTYGLLNARFQ